MLLGGDVGYLGVNEWEKSVLLGKRLFDVLRGDEDAREVLPRGSARVCVSECVLNYNTSLVLGVY